MSVDSSLKEEKLGVDVDIDSAREQVYGMSYSEWKEKHHYQKFYHQDF
mgnify:CR=1 FL=1